MRDRRLQRIETIVHRQEGLPFECEGCRLLGFGQHSTARLLRPGLEVFNCLALAPLRDSLGVDAQFLPQLSERGLRSLYCSSNGGRGRGAPMTNLSHNASFHS